jgi:hypothetical protein
MLNFIGMLLLVVYPSYQLVIINRFFLLQLNDHVNGFADGLSMLFD